MRTHFAAVWLESQICGACALILPLCRATRDNVKHAYKGLKFFIVLSLLRVPMNEGDVGLERERGDGGGKAKSDDYVFLPKV